MHQIMLTFDVEDFINSNAIFALRITLELLEKHKLKGLFFITGHMAEKLSNFPEILDLLNKNSIGFHSSSHSVRPTIPEYTDIKNYRKAYEASLTRETAHINPLTGKVEGEGGLYFLQDLFSPKKIESYRSPGNSWTPPHLEALANLGIKFDFSTDLTVSLPVNYRKITFYPFTFLQHWEGTLFDYRCLLSAILKREVAILDLHPSLYVNETIWDSIYYRNNPSALRKVHKKSIEEVKLLFTRFELLLKQINFLQCMGRSIEVTTKLSPSSRNLTITEKDLEKAYITSTWWPKKHLNYHPKFIHEHFNDFFEAALR